MTFADRLESFRANADRAAAQAQRTEEAFLASFNAADERQRVIDEQFDKVLNAIERAKAKLAGGAA